MIRRFSDDFSVWERFLQTGPSDRFYLPLEDYFLRRGVDLTDAQVDRFREWAFSVFDPFGTLYQAAFPGRLRRAGGEYYTPEAMARELLESALDESGFDAVSEKNEPFSDLNFDRKNGQKIGRNNGRKSGRNLLTESPISSIPSILDPSCGSGRFLLCAFDYFRSRGVPAAAILPRLAGFDVNALSLLTARANLALELAKRGDLDAIVRSGPALRLIRRDVVVDPPTDTDGAIPPFDLLIGNPPWIHWDRLPAAYRRATEPLWRRYGLFNLSGSRSRLGGGKKEFAGLFLLAAADRFLKPGGVLASVIPMSLLKSGASGEGFRRLGGEVGQLAFRRIDDYSAAKPFAPLGTVAATILLRKGEAARFPVPGRVWVRRGEKFEVAEMILAEPSEPNRRESALKFTRCSPAACVEKKSGGPALETTGRTNQALFSERIARLGVNTAGANGLFWLVPADDGGAVVGPAVLMRNQPALGKRPFPEREVRLESELLFPLLRWRDVGPFSADPSVWLLMPHDARRRRGLDERTLTERFPLTRAYLAPFEEELRARAAYRRWSPNGPFWSLFNICADSLAPRKVVWRRMDRVLTAAAVLPDDRFGGKPILPQETLSFIPVDTDEEADYYAALLNSDAVRERAASVSLAGSKGFGSPSLFRLLELEAFDPTRPAHRRMADEGRARRNDARL